MDTVRWGIIGCGDVTEIKSGPAFQKIEGSEIVAVMRRNAEKAKDYAKRHNVSAWYDDAEKLIEDPEVNAVYIATPPASHAEYALRVARAGKPVYVEKPMAVSHSECVKMVDGCRDAGVPLCVAYYRRRLPTYLKAKELIEGGDLGEIRFVSVHLTQPPGVGAGVPEAELPWRIRPEIAGGGLFFDLGSHMLDILDFILGPITEVQGHALNQAGLYNAEDIVCTSFRFESGVLGTGLWCFSLYEGGETDRTEIVGSKGSVCFSCFEEPGLLLKTSAGEKSFPFENPAHIQQPLIQTVVDQLRGKGTCPSTGESAARTARVMDEMVKG